MRYRTEGEKNTTIGGGGEMAGRGELWHTKEEDCLILCIILHFSKQCSGLRSHYGQERLS